MAIITLTTDLGIKDFYVAAIKGSILSECPSAQIVDISHHIPPFGIQQAAFNLKSCFQDFPEGSIHIIGVDPAESDFQEHVIAYHEGHYFLGANNGIFSLLFLEEQMQLLKLKPNTKEPSTFPVKDVFAKVACQLINGVELSELTTENVTIVEKTSLVPTVEQNSIRGMISYLDSMGNITCNITERLFHHVGQGRNFEIQFRRSGYRLKVIKENYHEVPEGEIVALFNTSGFLEIAINKGNAEKLLGMKLSDVIRVDFE